MNNTITRLRTISCIIFFWTLSAGSARSNPIIFDKNFSQASVGKEVQMLVDSGASYTAGNITAAGKFIAVNNDAPIFFLQNKSLWGRFSVTNLTADSAIFFCIQYPNISAITFYEATGQQHLQLLSSVGNQQNFYPRTDNHVDYNFKLHLAPGHTGTYYFRVKSEHAVELRMTLLTYNELTAVHSLQSIIMAAYLGVMISILLYNLFLFFATRDQGYIIYVIYLFILVAAQLTFAGWSFKYLWPSHPWINRFAVIWTSGLVGIAAIAFAISFLHTKNFLPKIHRLLFALIGVDIIALLLSFTPYLFAAYPILNFCGVASGLLLLYVSAAIYAKGYKPALYYLLAWSAFLIGLIILAFRNIGLLPVNTFTTYVLFGGSAIEAILLSIALADKITALRKEKEVSQAESLRISQENEQLVREQNAVLERKVAERTEELQDANSQISLAFKNLKDAQIQLVESEKMASLGQLTAGIAHEINNPINFVKSNIKPLQLDIKDIMEVISEYDKLHNMDSALFGGQLQEIEALKKSIDIDFVKDEIENLMKGIENGAERTAEIVRGLRTFSRLDESVIKTVNIHEGIDSTLILLRSNLPTNVTVVKEYNAEGTIECFPGKLNQVFMNILSNAVQAVKAKPQMTDNEKIVIGTRDISKNEIEIRIGDSGMGMPASVKQKIFDPFFTTKEVGEGTGLGLAIVFKIIQEHSGKIDVVSAEGEGSEFILTLNHLIPGKPKI